MKFKANKFFSEGNYQDALPVYTELLKLFPKEPEYLYGKGVCLLNLNIDLEESVRLLRLAAQSDFSSLAWYQLGRALHLHYSFDDAIKAYSKFLIAGKKSDIKKYHVERLIEMARNGLEHTRTGVPVKVQSTKSIKIEQLDKTAEINSSGKLMRKPLEFCSKADIKNNYKPWMYLPSYTELNEYIFVSGYEPGKKSQKQIFRIKNINHETWGIPEPLNSIVNSRYDEEYPYFEPKTSTLYFSSKGHSSMGGYDIFKSVYDWNTKSWSKPENMGFPINSPYDDIVYLTDELNHSASFTSTRNSVPGEAKIYRIKLEKESSGMRFVSIDDIRKASELDEPAIINEAEIAQKTVDIVNNSPENSEKVIPKPINNKDNYDRILSEALLIQIKADSFARITRDLRIAAKETTNDSEKKQLISAILKNDKQAKILQREADLKFIEARKLNQGNKNSDSVLTMKKSVNEIIIYQYDKEINEKIDTSYSKSIAISASKINNKIDSIKSESFNILTDEAYNDSFPIPPVTNVHNGLIYRIQLGVFSKQKPNNSFGGITPIAFEKVEGSNVLKYYAGLFYSLNSVSKALETIRSKGFPDAFIVAFNNGVTITTEKAREIEFNGNSNKN